MPHRAKIGRGFRPRAGGLATTLFLAGLAATALGTRLVGPAQAQSVANPNDQPTASTLPPDMPTVKAHPEAAHTRNTGVSARRTLAPATAVTGEDSRRVDPTEHLSGSMRRGG